MPCVIRLESTFATGLDYPYGLAFPPAPPLQVVGVGIQSNQFGFTLMGSNNEVVLVEACTNLDNPVWQRVQTNILTGGSYYFSDPQWTNCPSRFYLLISQ